MSLVDELEKLHRLRVSGAINDDEYALAKARLLQAGPAEQSYSRDIPVAEEVTPGRQGFWSRVRERCRGAADSRGDFWDRLRLSRSDYVVAGVCGGLARVSPFPSWVWRMAFVGSLVAYGVGAVPYILLAIFMPEDDKEPEAAQAAR